MATFVHNEPTCLTVIQEAGLPQAFYTAIDVGLEPMIEVIQAVPNALGALCLNAEGQAQLASRPSLIPGLFAIFTSERHLKVLADKENAVMMGTAIDELVRHHPSLKKSVLESLKATMSKIEEMGNVYVPEKEQEGWYTLLPTTATKSDENAGEETRVVDVTMAEPDTLAPTPARTAAPTPIPTLGDEVPQEENTTSSHTNSVVSFIDVLGRFLEGLFQHHLHCEEFISTIGGLEALGRITALPCLPYDFGNSLSSDSLVQVIRTLAESNATETLAFLSRLVKQSLEENEEFWGTCGGPSKLGEMLEFSGSYLPLIDLAYRVSSFGTEQESEGVNARYRKLITLQTRVTLISEVYASAGHTTGRTAYTILQALMGPDAPKIIPDLGSLHRACIWENIVLKKQLPDHTVEVGGREEKEAAAAALGQNTDAEGSSTEQASTSAGAANADVNVQESSATTEKPTPKKKNSQALKQLVTQIPAALAPLFQGKHIRLAVLT
jgi:E3 ubiquitin-protein ligase HUWE1